MDVIETLAKSPVGIGIINEKLTVRGNIMRLNGGKIGAENVNVRVRIGKINTPCCDQSSAGMKMVRSRRDKCQQQDGRSVGRNHEDITKE